MKCNPVQLAQVVDQAIAKFRERKRDSPCRPARRNSQPFHVERGWRNHDGRLRGFYRVRGGRAYDGQIVERSGNLLFYVRDATGTLKRGPHGSCFRQCELGTDWYWVHMSPEPQSVLSGIVAVENVIRKAVK